MPENATSGDRLHLILVMLCVSVPSFMINLDSNIVAVSLPSIAHALKADFTGVEWVISAYTLTFASMVLPAGAFADRYGRKRILVAGLGVFSLASLVCGAAPTIGILNGARALQGIGAALQLSAALATLSHVFQGETRAKAFAFWGSVVGIAVMLGPIAGGFITQGFGWEWAFYVNVPVGVALIVLIVYAVPESRDPNAQGIDAPGVATFAGSLFLATLALISGNRNGWTDTAVLGEAVAALALFVAFIWLEAERARPMADLNFFRRPTYVGAIIAQLAFASALLTMLTYLPMYFQAGLGFTPLRAGLSMLPMAFPLFLVPRLSAAILNYHLSGRSLLTLGLALVSIGLVWMGIEAPRFDYSSMLGGMLIAGAGAGLLNGETTKVTMTAIPAERSGMASGISGTCRFAGVVIGFAALGAILFGRVTAIVSDALPFASTAEHLHIARAIVAGNLSVNDRSLALQAFGSGYRAIFLSGALIAAASAVSSFCLVRAADTAALIRRSQLPA